MLTVSEITDFALQSFDVTRNATLQCLTKRSVNASADLGITASAVTPILVIRAFSHTELKTVRVTTRGNLGAIIGSRLRVCQAFAGITVIARWSEFFAKVR